MKRYFPAYLVAAMMTAALLVLAPLPARADETPKQTHLDIDVGYVSPSVTGATLNSEWSVGADLEDEFSNHNALGLSGQFIFNQNGAAVINQNGNPNSPVIFNQSGNNRGLIGGALVAINGKHYFGDKDAFFLGAGVGLDFGIGVNATGTTNGFFNTLPFWQVQGGKMFFNDKWKITVKYIEPFNTNGITQSAFGVDLGYRFSSSY